MPTRRGTGGVISSIFDAVENDLPPETTVEDDSVHLNSAIDWLFQSQDVTDSGGSAATYNLLLGWEDAYPETTGYIIPTLFEYANFADSEEARRRAIQMSEWLLSTQRPDGSFPSGTGSSGDPSAFNTGQILLGLISAFEETSEEKYIQAIQQACDWLVEVQHEDGHWADFDYKNHAHAYSARIAWPMLEAARVLDGDSEDIVNAARDTLLWVVDCQEENGWFTQAGFEAGDDPFLHTIAYTIRGVLEGGLLLDNEEVFQAGKRAADILLEMQSNDGILKGAYSEEWTGSWYYCLTGNAQMAIVWLRLFEETNDQNYRFAARHTIQFLKRHQPLDASPNISGGLAGSYPIFGEYIYLRFPNWAAKFFADSLLADARIEENRALDANEDAENDPSRSNPLQVCLLFDGEETVRWVAEAIEEMLAETNAEISLVVINDDSGLLSSGNIQRGMKYPAYAAFLLISGQLNKSRKSPQHDDNVHISEISEVDDAEWVRTYPANVEGLWNSIDDEVVRKIDSSSDVVFRRGFGLIQGEALSATEHGMLSYHHGDPRKYRGGPAGFWEFMHGEDQAGMMVQSLRPELDSGVIRAYDEIDISDATSWREIRESLYSNSTGLLADAIGNIQDQPQEPMMVEEPGPIYNPPSASELSSFILKSLWRRIY